MFSKSQNHVSTAPWNKRRLRDLALFDLGLDSKLGACDLLNLRVSVVSNGETVNNRAAVLQQKTGRPVRFEIMRKSRRAATD